MADGTKIEWTNATWNPITGCSLASPGCTNCYAMKLAGTRMRKHESRKGLTIATKAGPIWNGEVRFNEQWLDLPLRWKRTRMIFVCAHGDLFHESVPDKWIDHVFAVMALCPQHIFQVLTKRADRMQAYMSNPEVRHNILHASSLVGRDWKENAQAVWHAETWPLSNVWLGVSVEDQKRADDRVPHLLATPAAVRWLSCEPLLGPVELGAVPMPTGTEVCDCPDHRPTFDALNGSVYCEGCCEGPERFDTGLDWIVVGGESGKGARPMHPKWARALRDQCAEAGVPFFFKQWGDWAPICEMSDASIDGAYHPAPAHSPDASRKCRVDQCVLHSDGSRFDGRAMYERPAFEQGSGAMTMMAIGKRAAGRLLETQTHNGMPA